MVGRYGQTTKSLPKKLVSILKNNEPTQLFTKSTEKVRSKKCYPIAISAIRYPRIDPRWL